MEAKSLTPTVYDKVGDCFRNRFDKAGWAHSVLFAAELPYFKQKLPLEMIQEMDEFDFKMRDQRKRKKEAKEKHEKIREMKSEDHLETTTTTTTTATMIKEDGDDRAKSAKKTKKK